MSDQRARALEAGRNPFSSPLALKHSNYCAPSGQALVRLLDFKPVSARSRFVHDALRAFLLSDDYPCVGAMSVLRRGGYRFGTYPKIGSEAATHGLARDLCAFAMEVQPDEDAFASFIAVFDDVNSLDERAFEAALWSQLSSLRALDKRVFEYDPSVSSDPQSVRFAFSFAGTALFVVGLHPGSGRMSRRFAWPALVFNPHTQFRRLREAGRYSRFQQTVRKRDRNLQGTLNPNLSDFGHASEARQYAGRAVEEDWKCPFRH
ncbi:MAG: YqcI/YcgG family protein [Candidatus Eremiobacteraeota bacterium]|nr:YqcI/YcgG family protein [Candidatus Eremiobacteraeota bacterium]